MSAIQILERNHKRLLVFDLAFEPFLKEGLAGVFGVLLREEGNPGECCRDGCWRRIIG